MSTFFLKRALLIVAGAALLLSPTSSLIAQEVEVSVSDVETCRKAVLQDYQTDLREATDAFRSTMLQQWERQIGFRVRAASTARRASIERALRADGRRQERALATAIDGFIRNGYADTNQLPGLLRNEDPSPAFERWADRVMPSVDGLRRPLNAMEISLRLYANTRDRGVIRSIWQDTMRKSLSQLKEEFTIARGTAAHGFMTCEVDPSGGTAGDEEEADMGGTSEDSASASSATSGSATMSGSSAGAPGSTSSAGTGSTTTSASSRPTTSSAGNVPTVPSAVVVRARVFVVTEGVVPATLCTATVLSRVELEGTPGARVAGRFYFDDESVSERKTVTLDTAGRGTAEFRRQVVGVAGSRALTGNVRFIAEAENIVESSRVTFSHECPTTRGTAADAGSTSGAANGSVSSSDGTGSAASAASRISMSLDLEGSETVRTCGSHTFRVVGNVLVTNATKFKYRWEFSDGVLSDERVDDMSAAGSRVQYDWTLSGSQSNWIRMRVLDPVNSASEPITFTLEQDCGQGAAGTGSSTASGAQGADGTTPAPGSSATSGAGATSGSGASSSGAAGSGSASSADGSGSGASTTASSDGSGSSLGSGSSAR